MGIINCHFPYFRIGGLYIWMCDRIASLQTNSRSPDSMVNCVYNIYHNISFHHLFFVCSISLQTHFKFRTLQSRWTCACHLQLNNCNSPSPCVCGLQVARFWANMFLLNYKRIYNLHREEGAIVRNVLKCE